ncbi:peptide ABC transporter substrate-binding protein [Rubellimicrobium aerolatum]|uniref:Peptide ABC transporter substrate-binding protein n=1 Tax=Rubellimicrobium aerolatum TaxID=490979 RepID=A0ABW0SAV4_9RHOB|nr:peptide ABC transporter substrate-binding protein [Rubellimicrobium aerolatum]MBP1806130.1 oligopeptide transport system substrate-binding protein [Rubellimicrobium aerolatum]
MTLRSTWGAASLLAMLAAGAVAQQATHPETGEPLAGNQTFTYRVLDEFPTIDPGLNEDVEGSHVARQMFEGLLNQDPQGNVIPGVATEWSASEDGLTWTFKLRPEARWSNGDPVTANDFVYAWRRAADPNTASQYSWYIELMKVENAGAVVAGEMPPDQLGVRAVDDQTLEVTLSQAIPYFPQMVTHTTTFPVPQKVIEEFGDQWTQPGNMVSNGAYVLSERVPQERLVMTRNENYWDNANTIVETVTALVINDESQGLTRWQAGELDQTDVPIGQFPRLSEEFPEAIHAVPNLCSYYYAVNVRPDSDPALLDVRVREALSLAIDRDVIVNAILAAGQIPAYTLAHSATAGYEPPEVPAASMTQAERNARAQELLAEAGYGEGGEPLTFEIMYNTDQAHQQLAVAIGQMWKQTLGVETTLANQEWQTFLDTRRDGNFQIARAAWCADYNEASSFLDLMTTDNSANDPRYENPEYDALMEESRTAADPLPLYQQAEAILARDVPILPIYFYTEDFLLDPSIKGYPFENAQENWYAKELYRVAEE